jgi:putative heme-binding domain-containing protein
VTECQKLTLSRVYGLAFIIMDKPDEATRQRMIERFAPHYRAQSRDLNAELCQMLVYLQAPSAAEKTIPLLKQAPTQEEQIEYAKSLRLLTNGRTMDLRRDYFRWFTKAANYKGGASFDKFVEYIKNDAVSNLPQQAKAELQPILDAKPEQKSPLELMSEALAGRSFVKEWSVDELAPAAKNDLKNRSFERGRKMFGAAACYACHRFKNEGGAIGPDLTTIGNRFSARDLLESIIQPSKEISDQYGQIVVTLNDGSRVTGRIMNLHGDNLSINTDMFAPGKAVNINRNRVKSIKSSQVSMMPEGLLNMLTQEEIFDLMAYLLSGGDPDHPMFTE